MSCESETLERISECVQQAESGESIPPSDALWLYSLPEQYSPMIQKGAESVREHFMGKMIDPCTVMNAKSGGCSEDCHFCAQSTHFRTIAPTYELLAADTIVDAAEKAQKNGTRRFCIGTSGRSLENPLEVRVIENALGRMREELGLWSCATLGSIGRNTIDILKEAGLNRIHHNLETSRNHFPAIVTTHSYDDRIETIRQAKEAGMSVCSGGIFGVGESIADRVALFSLLKELDVDSVPINFLVPIAGTPLFDVNAGIETDEALRVIAIARLSLPQKEVRICGGRIPALKNRHTEIFSHGANGVMIGNYLTRTGRPPDEDIRMIKEQGLELVPPHNISTSCQSLD